METRVGKGEVDSSIILLQVDPRHFPLLGNWNRSLTMESVLVELRREMAAQHNRRLPQPPEGSKY